MDKTTTTLQDHSETAYTVVRRKLPLAVPLESDCEGRIREALAEMDGVKQVRPQPEKKRIVLQYDATKLDVQRVADTLSSLGCPVANTFWSRLKKTWYGFLDENIRDNAAAPPRPCCIDTSRVSAGRHKH